MGGLDDCVGVVDTEQKRRVQISTATGLLGRFGEKVGRQGKNNKYVPFCTE